MQKIEDTILRNLEGRMGYNRTFMFAVISTDFGTVTDHNVE